jgi:hypothetical protein
MSASLPPRSYGNMARNAAGYTAQKTANAYRYVAPRVSTASQWALRRFRNMGASTNAKTLGFLLTLANVNGLRNNMRYSDLRAIANRHLAAKTGRPLIFTDGATTVIRRVANTLPNNQRVLNKLVRAAQATSATAAMTATVYPTPTSIKNATDAALASKGVLVAAQQGNVRLAANRLVTGYPLPPGYQYGKTKLK